MFYISKLKKYILTPSIIRWAGIILIVISLTTTLFLVYQELTPEILGSFGYGYVDSSLLKPPLQLMPQLPDPVSGIDGSQNIPTPAPLPQGMVPEKMVINKINLIASIIPVHYKNVTLNGQEFIQWEVPSLQAAGWHEASARLGVFGNTVLNGHHNVYGKVFKDLINLSNGDLIEVYSGEMVFKYKIDSVLLLPEIDQSNEIRIKNASWIMPTTDERLTLVTCWPPESNTHRLIVVAFPVKDISQASQ